MHKKILKGYIIFLVVLGILLNGGYFYIHVVALCNQDTLSISEKQVLISVITLNLSWVFLYIWFILEPIKRSFILLLSAFSMLLSHGLYLFFVVPSFSYSNTFIVLILSLMFFSGGIYLRK